MRIWPGLGRGEAAVYRPQRGIRVGGDALHLLVGQELHVAVHRLVQPPIVLPCGPDPFLFRQGAIPVLLEAQGGVRAGKLPAHERLLLLPGVGHQVDVLHEPGVVVAPHARRPGTARGFGLDPVPERQRGFACVGDRLIKRRMRATHLHGETAEVPRLGVEGSDSGLPKVGGLGVGEVDARLVQQRRYPPDASGELFGVAVGEWVGVGPQVDEAVHDRPLVSWHVAARGEDGCVVGRIPRPGPTDAMIEVESVHLGPHDVPVDLLLDAPAGGFEGRQRLHPPRQRDVLRGHCRGGVVGHAVQHGRLLEVAPRREERDELGVGGAGCGGRLKFLRGGRVVLRGTRVAGGAGGGREGREKKGRELGPVHGVEVRDGERTVGMRLAICRRATADPGGKASGVRLQLAQWLGNVGRTAGPRHVHCANFLDHIRAMR